MHIKIKLLLIVFLFPLVLSCVKPGMAYLKLRLLSILSAFLQEVELFHICVSHISPIVSIISVSTPESRRDSTRQTRNEIQTLSLVRHLFHEKENRVPTHMVNNPGTKRTKKVRLMVISYASFPYILTTFRTNMHKLLTNQPN